MTHTTADERAVRDGDEPSPLPLDEMVCLLEATRDLNSSSDLKAGLERVAERLRSQVPFDTLGILLLDDLGRELSFELALGYAPEVTEHWRFGMGQGIVGTVAQSRRPLLVDDVRADPRYINACPEMRSELAVPLVTKDRTVGVLDVGSATPSFFTDDHVQLLSFLAGHLATAIEAARLNRNMRQQARTLSLLHELSREFTSILDRQELLERVADLLRRHVAFDLFGVLLWDDESQVLEPWLSLFSDNREAPDGEALALGEGICGTAAALRQPLRVSNVQLDARYVPCVPDLDVRSELAVPLIFKDRLIGVLVLDSVRYDAFRPRHEQLLSTLASPIAIALENARLYEKLQEEEERLQSDLATAREIQKQLLPKKTPWMSGLQLAVAYEPARHLGGDFYDFLPYGPDRVAIAVGDVAGKATSAALYGSLAIGVLREYAAERGNSPARVLADMNNKLHHLDIDNRFLAMTFAVYDAATRELQIASSGLPHPYLLRAGELRELPVEGIPLGLFGDRTYDQLDLRLESGDALVIASDGVEDALDPDGEEFGLERLEQTLRRHAGRSAREIADGVIEATEHFARGTEPWDDRTLLVLRVE